MASAVKAREMDTHVDHVYIEMLWKIVKSVSKSSPASRTSSRPASGRRTSGRISIDVGGK